MFDSNSDSDQEAAGEEGKHRERGETGGVNPALGSTGWKGWVEGLVEKVTSAMPEPTEAKKILPLGLMLFFILFDYTILRDTKVRVSNFFSYFCRILCMCWKLIGLGSDRCYG